VADDNLFSLSGKVALVTGGNTGVGLGFANGLARAGADLAIWGRREEANEEAARKLCEHGGRVLPQVVDVAEKDQVEASFTAAVAELGRVDTVVVNAGVNSWPASFLDLTDEEYHRLLAVNQHGAFHTLRAAVAHMVARAEAGDPGGSLITCGSASVLSGVPRIEHYSAAKGALLSMTKGLAVEYGRYGIRANMVCPGRIRTELGGPAADARRADEGRYEVLPIPRAGTVADLEGIVVYLAADCSSYHTGNLISIDGGLMATLPGTRW